MTRIELIVTTEGTIEIEKDGGIVDLEIIIRDFEYGKSLFNEGYLQDYEYGFDDGQPYVKRTL